MIAKRSKLCDTPQVEQPVSQSLSLTAALTMIVGNN